MTCIWNVFTYYNVMVKYNLKIRNLRREEQYKNVLTIYNFTSENTLCQICPSSCVKRTYGWVQWVMYVEILCLKKFSLFHFKFEQVQLGVSQIVISHWPCYYYWTQGRPNGRKRLVNAFDVVYNGRINGVSVGTY